MQKHVPDKSNKTKNKIDKLEFVEGMANELLGLMGTKAMVEVREDKENEAIRIDVETKEETGLLIGRRGETLNAIQSILAMILRKETGEWSRLIVDVGSWREKQESYLKELAEQTAEKVVETGLPQNLYNLTPSQRRAIHLKLSGSPDVTTESVGEEKDRYLVVKPKVTGEKR